MKQAKGSAKTVREPDVAATVVGAATTENVDETTRSVLGPSDAAKAATDDAFDDLTLRCVLYACMFQILIDKKDYEEALEQMEVALAVAKISLLVLTEFSIAKLIKRTVE